MKKFFRFREKRKTDDSHSHFSELSNISMASTAPSLSTGGGYPLRDKHLKKLHKASSVGNEQKLKNYLECKKYDVNGRDKRSRTPLHLACANGYTHIVSLLIENQCKINVQDSENRTPLIKAVECQQESCAVTLLLHGADPNLVDVYGNTALHYAACGQNISLANTLLEHKANLEAKNKDGYTPLLLAVAENNENMVKFLLKKGADVNASDKNHRTAIMIALIIEPISSVKLLLLQQDIDLACKDIYGFTAEEYASFSGFTTSTPKEQPSLPKDINQIGPRNTIKMGINPHFGARCGHPLGGKGSQKQRATFVVANKSSGQIGGLYWGSDSLLDLWVSGVLGIDMASSRTGMSTGAQNATNRAVLNNSDNLAAPLVEPLEVASAAARLRLLRVFTHTGVDVMVVQLPLIIDASLSDHLPTLWQESSAAQPPLGAVESML
ncbi:ankyrin repeat domain-containing protein 7 [Apodemus sylvaticus]|uniref:ankyrin repeat domain-containing protein 7 n=1 Tax=Apodemus sylvaticus TaxID=10129 RepID=UPI0022438484|nr:ankyrin repeat domain-containing protein 7 [Apodemus sylvaticus]